MYTPPKRDLRRHGKSDKIRLLARCFMSKNETESDILRRMRAPVMRDRATQEKAFAKLEGKLSADQGNFVQDALKNIIVQAVVAIPDSAEPQVRLDGVCVCVCVLVFVCVCGQRTPPCFSHCRPVIQLTRARGVRYGVCPLRADVPFVHRRGHVG